MNDVPVVNCEVSTNSAQKFIVLVGQGSYHGGRMFGQTQTQIVQACAVLFAMPVNHFGGLQYNISCLAGTLPFVFEEGFGFDQYVEFALDMPMYFVYRCALLLVTAFK